MKNSYLKFVGTGSAFNTKLGCTSAYIKYDDTLLLIDCGGPIYEKLVNSDILDNKIKGINIFITHTHPDHCGSLGDLIFHCKYTLGIEPKVYCADEKLTDGLEIFHVTRDLYEFHIFSDGFITTLESESLGNIIIESIATKHKEDIISTGYIFNIQGTKFYYSGDSVKLPKKIKYLIKNNELDYIYQDTCGLNYDGNPHMALSNLVAVIPEDFKEKVYCMHLDKHVKEEDILSNGFNIVKNDIHKEETIAIYPGSFDPITYGHLNMIEKASKMFDKVIVSVLVNEDKHPTFTMEERVNFIKQCIKKYPNVEVKMFKGLLAVYAKQENANVIVKGLRNMTDFEYELHQGMINKQLNSEIDTTFLIPDAQYQNMSSSVLRAIAGYKGDIDWITPKEIIEEVKSKYHY
jgi:pantetheine-phosphate adenylyltransferase